MGLISGRDTGHLVHEGSTSRGNDLSFAFKGGIAPFIEISLRPGEGVVCDSISLLKHDLALAVRPWPGLDGQRWLVVNPQTSISYKLLLGSFAAGCVAAFDLSEHGGRLLVPRANLVANGPGVTAGYYARFRALGLSMVLVEGNGWVFLKSGGDMESFRLDPGEKSCVRAHHVAALTSAVDFDMLANVCGMQTETVAGSEGFVMLTGPGRVWLQSTALTAVRRPAGARAQPRKIKQSHTGSLAFRHGTGA